jgi:hypothetical protein
MQARMGAAQHGAKISHLPHQPYIGLDASCQVLRIKFARLFGEIPEVRAGLEYRNSVVRIRDGWNFIVG